MERKEAIEVIKKNWPDSSFTMLREALETLIPELKENEGDKKPNGGIVSEDFNEGEGFYKVNLAYLNKEQVEEIEGLVKKWNLELAELEDEKIRKALINKIKCLDEEESKEGYSFYAGDYTADDCIAWLERRGEKTEPIEDFDTEFERQISHLIASAINREHEYNKGYIKWAAQSLIEYAKREIEKQGEQKPDYCHHEVDLSGCSEEYCKAYYDGWNNCNQQHAQLEAEQKPATWSEEEELHLRELESLVKRVWAIAEHENDKETIHKMSDLSFFLKTLKPQPKQEWSEKEQDLLNSLDSVLIDVQFLINQNNNSLGRVYSINEHTVALARKWLKSLRPQTTWKPSEEQMDMLAKVCSTLHLTSGENEIMESIYDALKKLREEDV